MNSALYEGTVHHARPGPHGHRFRYRVAMPLLDLSELHEVFSLHPLWSVERPNVVAFRRADFLGRPDVPLDAAVRDLVGGRLGWRPVGPIRMLAHVRTWGWLFNPMTLYLCMDRAGEQVEAVVLEVTNTPWHERHAYVLSGGSGEHLFAKQMHVSPFFGMDQAYRLRLRQTADSLVVGLSNLEGGRTVFDATLNLRRRELSRSALSRMLWRHPAMTVRVSAAIYLQAFLLRLRGAPVHRHPGRAAA